MLILVSIFVHPKDCINDMNDDGNVDAEAGNDNASLMKDQVHVLFNI